jgi:hypothetical protein
MNSYLDPISFSKGACTEKRFFCLSVQIRESECEQFQLVRYILFNFLPVCEEIPWYAWLLYEPQGTGVVTGPTSLDGLLM